MLRRSALSWGVALVAVLDPSAFGGQTPPPPPADDGHPKIAPERIHRYERQPVELTDLTADGYILDIGGGGEGIIGQLKPKQVIAIDISARELAGAPPGPLKIVMDASDLKFLDDTFPTATSFFTLMYMNPETQRKTMHEIHRVLAPGGRFLVWEVRLPARTDPVKDIAVFPLRITWPGHAPVETGYGTFFPKEPHDVDWFRAMARDAGFDVVTDTVSGLTCYLELRKPAAAKAGTAH